MKGNTKVIAVYGSLKQNRYNHSMLSGSEFLSTSIITGKMYLISTYPALTLEGDIKYMVELYRVSEETYESIKGMEIGAGYVEKTVEFTTDNGKDKVEAIIYIASKELEEHCEKNYKVVSGY